MYVEEKIAKNVKHLFNDKILKRQTKNIAKSVQYPIISGVFGTYENAHCHMRIDLN
jgi:hypothetical protein